MKTVHSNAELREELAFVRSQGRTIGFVPTMGALHEGHRSLVRLSKQQTDVTVVSIFVNPTQFAQGEDFDRYPRTLESDAKILLEEKVELLFLPDAAEMYPKGFATSVHVSGVTELYEGAIRPGHFDGVATVVYLLMHEVEPTILFLGQKDAQQVAVLKRMVQDLRLPVMITVGETVREGRGLALSSRNRMLDEEALSESDALYAALQTVRNRVFLGDDPEAAKRAGIAKFERIATHGKLDYLDIVHSETFQSVPSFERVGAPVTIIIAARFGSTRLIDNMKIDT